VIKGSDRLSWAAFSGTIWPQMNPDPELSTVSVFFLWLLQHGGGGERDAAGVIQVSQEAAQGAKLLCRVREHSEWGVLQLAI
jgi:hypothetical protein